MPVDFIIPPIDPSLAIGNVNVPRFFVTPEPSDQALGKTYIGTPYYDELTFYAPTANTFFVGGIVGGVVVSPSPLSNLVMQTVLIEINQTKLIQKTSVTGLNGTVKEYISDGDYQVRITGAIVGEYANQYPKVPLSRLISFCKIADSIKVTSKFLQMFDIGSIVIEDYHIGEQMGSRNMIPFEISALSDKPIEFQLQ